MYGEFCIINRQSEQLPSSYTSHLVHCTEAAPRTPHSQCKRNERQRQGREFDYRLFTDDDLGVWRGAMTGPEDTPYEDRVFEFTIEFPAAYPAEAPKFRFNTPIKVRVYTESYDEG